MASKDLCRIDMLRDLRMSSSSSSSSEGGKEDDEVAFEWVSLVFEVLTGFFKVAQT